MSEGNIADFDTVVLRSVRLAAKRSHGAQHGYVDVDDLVQEGYVYILENMAKVKGWIETGDVPLLQHALYQWMHKYTMKQRYLKDGTQPGDYYRYQLAVLEELLPEALGSGPGTGPSASDLGTQVKSGKPLSEAGDRMAMIADVKASLLALSDYEKELVLRRFHGEGETEQMLAQWFEKSQPTIARHLNGALRKMARKLGSEPVRSRKVVSNAQAQHDTREQQ